MKFRSLLPLVLVAGFAPLACAQNEIGFIEKFALAPDREAVLTELTPGSEEFYFFHALQYQNTRNAAKLKAIMAQWAKRFPDSPQRKIIENREALLDYDTHPAATLKFLRDRLHVEFNHEQAVVDQKPDLPTALDPKLITRDAFAREALEGSDDLEKLKVGALESLVIDKTPLSDAQRRALLSKLTRPDLPGLVGLILADLKTKESSGFGEFDIHEALLPEQLDELAARMPALLDDERFVFTRLRKLAPSADADLEFDPAEQEAWLDRVWAYARKLSPAFNTLKAQILYRRLRLDRSRGTYDRARFLEYLKLPRRADYVRPEYLDRAGTEEKMVDLAADLSDPLLSAVPIGDDEWLIREYLLQLFKNEASWEPWAVYLRDTYVKPLFAEAKITNGLGDPERWAALLSPTAFQALKGRVDLDFLASNPQFHRPGDDVTLSIFVKNVPKLIIKIYEVNTLSFFLTQKRQLNTDLQLDGFVANVERTVEFNDPPLRRIARQIEFPELKGRRGAWLIEFIGGGKSSRALVRKGQWSLLEQVGPAGDMLTVLDEQHTPVPDATVWLDGRKYTVNGKTGQILVPFTQQPGTIPIILADAKGEFATLTTFEHHDESYSLDAAFHLDREQLLSRREASVAIRANLRIGDTPVAVGLLLEPRLTITSTTLDGISTTREIKDLHLDPAKVLVQTFTVPDRLATIKMELSAKVERLGLGGEKKELSASQDWKVNGIDTTEATSDGHFSLIGKLVIFEMLGKNGEPLPDQAVTFKFFHRDFDSEIEFGLRTDEHGRVDLGELPGISKVEATLSNGRVAWAEFSDRAAFPTTIDALAGEDVEVPWLGDAKLSPANVSLLEERADSFVKNRFDALKLVDGVLTIKGLSPGDYRLQLRGKQDEEIHIRVTAGVSVGGWLVGPNRSLERRNSPPVHIQSITSQADAILVQLRNANAFTRIHVTATRFLPEENLFQQLGDLPDVEPGSEEPAREPDIFVSGRLVGDEYRYILERRYAVKFPGKMLARPGLLLAPWETRSTDLQPQAMAAGEAPSAGGAGRERSKSQEAEEEGGGAAKSVVPLEANGPNLDFLAATSRVLYNLVPDAQGVVRIDRKLLGDRQDVQVYAEDLSSAELREIGLPEQPAKFQDLRLARNLDPQKRFTETKEATVLTAGKSLVLGDLLTSELETYDSLASVFTLFGALNHDTNLTQFAWILEWPKMKEDEKRAKYAEFACHELNFFLAHKDPDFFQKVVQPYLRNKKDKTFLDEWLIGADLRHYLEPWAYGRLNVVERALLAQRIPAETASTARHLRELWEILPPQPDLEERLFETALYGQAMEGEGDLQKAQPAVAAAATIPGLEAIPATPTTPTANPAGEGVAGGGAGLKPHQDASQVTSATTASRSGNLAISQNAIDALLAGTSGLAVPSPATAALAGVFTDPKFQVVVHSLDKTKELGDSAEPAERSAYYLETDVAQQLRGEVRQFYRKIGPAKEWAENNYYHLPIAQQNADLIPANAFWRDYASWDGKSPFLSPYLAEASRNFSEMMFALAVLDFPFEAPKGATKSENGQFTLTAAGPLIAFHKEIEPARDGAPDEAHAGGELLVSENFFRQGDSDRQEGNEKFAKYVTGEFLAGVVYGAKVVVTNPDSAPQKLGVLLQIPQGALPVLGSKPTDCRSVRLEAYSTQTFEYYFYFPAASPTPWPHYPAHVSRDGLFAGSAKAASFIVVKHLTEIDKTSWEYLSQYGSDDDVFTYLEKNNLQHVDLERIAWRARKSVDFFHKLVAGLGARHVYSEVIYRYALQHNDTAALRTWLRHRDDLLSECGPFLASKLLTIDPIERETYEHLEYAPLINQRAHRVGNENTIANGVLLSQYQSLLRIFAHKPRLEGEDEMSLVVYLFLQDRVPEALSRLAAIKPDALPTRLQYDYLRCYAAFYEGKLAEARGITAQYSNYPVDRWRKLFNDAASQLDEIDGKAPPPARPDGHPDREAQQGALAETEPSFDSKVENGTITLTWKNLAEVTINYYLMDPEFLFSNSPFVSQDPGRFSIVKPAKTAVQTLPEGRNALDLPLPEEFAKSNVLVEVLGAGQRKAQAFHANSINAAFAENYGRLEIRDQIANKAIPKAYVKVYARLRAGQIRFFKDGYTDLRGKFDYASLNSGNTAPVQPLDQSRSASGAPSLDYQMLTPAELGSVEKLAVLVLSETHGALVHEVNPPSE